jgi:hypothetical protein
MTTHQDTGQRCLVIHRDVYGQCIICACGKHVRPHEWMEHIGAAVEALSAKRDAEAAVIEAAKAMVDVVHPPKIENYREYMAALDNLVAAVTALRALKGDA